MRKLVVLFVAIAVSIVFSVSSGTAEKGFSVQARGEKRIALVIGNATYKSSPLKNTINDANDMEKALRNLNFEVIARVNAGHKDMEDAIREFGAKLRKADVGLFYYSGHGIQYNGVNFLIPADAEIDKETDLKYKAVQADMVLDEMDAAKNRMNIVILDACRNNPFPRGFRSARQGLAQMSAPSGMLIAYATSPDSVASDGSGRNGTYTENLLKYMTVPGLKIEELFKKVRIGVLQDSSNKQRPWESVSITDDFYFLADSGSIATEKPQTAPEPEKPKKATLNITADVSGAEVWVNGNKQGVLPKNFTISDAGKYEVEVTALGYKKYRTSKNVELGKEYEVAVHLEKEPVEALPAPVVKPPVQQKLRYPGIKYQLRSKPMTVSKKDLKKVFNLDQNGRPIEYIKNNFKDNGDGTISDHATNLMWHKSGSGKHGIEYEGAKSYIDELNDKMFAGYNDWRFPTVDELRSLLTPNAQKYYAKHYRYINPIFDINPPSCWTSDYCTSGSALSVSFQEGEIRCISLRSTIDVRAVRSLTP